MAPDSDDPVLFEIHKSHLNTGLRGYPVGTCLTSSVNAEQGVAYGGYPIAELAHLPSAAVIHLLFRKRLPDDAELEAFRDELNSRADVPQKVYDCLAALPKEGHPMEWLLAGLNLLGMTGRTGNWEDDALNLVARISGVVAAIFRLRSGWGDPIAPNHELSFGDNFAHMLGAPNAHPKLGELLGIFHVLHMDHGGGNLSTFTGKAVASSHADVYASMGGAMAALYGALHGRANQECLRFVEAVGSSDHAHVDAFVRKTLASGGKIFGFGHAVLRAEDPRARVQYEFAEKHFADDELVKTALALRAVVPPILKESPKISNPYPNVDAVSGSLLHAAGLMESDYYTLLFGWSRVAGIAAQIVDERTVMRGGKGVPIYRPRFVAQEQDEHHLS
ncbi:MAG: citrate (Si)-synthase [Planctomycetota bacterium]|jgi:citrate synthase